MSINFMDIFFHKIERVVKNTVDKAGGLCYTKTIGKQERQGTERHEKWRVKNGYCGYAYCCAYTILCRSIFWNFMFI
mgnify:CR=1 FL=1